MLKPVGRDLAGIGALSFRSQPRHYSLKDFSLRFYDAAELDAVPEQVAADRLAGLVQASIPEGRGDDGIYDERDVKGFFRAVGDPTPWFSRWREGFLESLNFFDAEFIDHPLACVIAVSAEEADPLLLFDRMKELRALPGLFQKGHYDPANLHRSFVVVQDCQSKDPNLAQKVAVILDAMGQFDCRVIKLNSRKEGDPLAWPTSTSSPDAPLQGQCLAKEDLDGLAEFVADFLLNGVLPHIERKMARLNDTVTATRKGIKNQVRMFFGKRQTAPVAKSAPGASARYELASGESKIRQLADFAFLMQDYDLAHSSYRLLQSDYKADKAWGFLASAQEMMGLSLAMTTGSNLRDLTGYLEAACASWSSIGDRRRALRASLWGVDALCANDRHADACAWLLRAVKNETGLAGALIKEQAAYRYLEHPFPQIRNYAFHLVMAGHLYHKVTQKTHGVRCYGSARSVYSNKGWLNIEDHLNYNLGRECFNLSKFEEAVGHFVDLIGKGVTEEQLRAEEEVIHRQSAERQSSFLREFVFVVKKWANGQPRHVPNLNLPTFVDASVKVVLHDEQTVPPTYAKAAWRNWLRRKPAMSLAAAVCNKALVEHTTDMYCEEDRAAVVHEPIRVVVLAGNPLAIDIQVQKIRLQCRLTKDGAPVEGVDALECSGVDIVLAPGEARLLELVVVCHVEGQLDIEGITWEVCDIIQGFHPLVLPPRQALQSNRGRLLLIEQPSLDLCVPVRQAMPRLQIKVGNFPKRMLHGECCICSVLLANTGHTTLDRLRLGVSHPGFVVISRPPGESALWGEEEIKNDYDYAAEGCLPYDYETGLISLPLQLAPGASTVLRMGLRGGVPGTHALSIIAQYHCKGRSEDQFRMAVFAQPLTVQPLVNVRLWTRASPKQVFESILGVEINDVHLTKSPQPLCIHSITVLSRAWNIKPLGQGPAGSMTLQPKESLNLFFRCASDPTVEASSGAGGGPFQPPHRSLVECDTPGPALDPVFEGLLRVEKQIMIHDERVRLFMNPAAKVAHVNAPSKLDCRIHWSTQDGSRTGWTQVVGSAVMKPAANACPLKAMLDYQQFVRHDFSQGPVCVVPVVIRLRNQLETQNVTCTFETLSPNEEFDSVKRTFKTVQSTSLQSRYLWAGRSTQKIDQLPPNQVLDLRLEVQFFHPGTFNLNRFRLTVEEDAKPRVFFFPLQHLISIQDPSEKPLPASSIYLQNVVYQGPIQRNHEEILATAPVDLNPGPPEEEIMQI